MNTGSENKASTATAVAAALACALCLLLASCASNRAVQPALNTQPALNSQPALNTQPALNSQPALNTHPATTSAQRPLKQDELHANGMTNHSFLNESNIGQEVTITGILQKSGSSFTLTEGADSRSRVTYDLEFSREGGGNEALNGSIVQDESTFQNGSTVQVTGILVSVASPWKKALKVLEIK